MTDVVAEDSLGYAQLVDRIRATVRRSVPPDATVLVVSRGDPELLDLGGRLGWHFPQRGDGVYAGHYPDDSASAIAHLEALRARGAEFFVLPATALWWLDHYGDLRNHLESRYRLLVRDEQTCFIYALFEPGARPRQSIEEARRDSDRAVGRRRHLEEKWTLIEDHVEPSLLNDLRTLFDADHYASQAGIEFPSSEDALLHYLEEGFSGGYDPHPLFDTRYYLEAHPRVKVYGSNPLVHFLRHGVARGPDPNPYFDTEYYYSQGVALRDNGVNALVHYVTNSPTNDAWHPNPLFRNGYYLATNPDVASTGQNPLAHYLAVGCRQGRLASPAHRAMVQHLHQGPRSALLRGRWRRGVVLLFTDGDVVDGGQLVFGLADVLATEYHLDSIVTSLRRPDDDDAFSATTKVLFLDDYQSACEVMRPSALRLLTKALCWPRPLFAVTDLADVLATLNRDDVPYYYLLRDGADLPGEEALGRTFEHASRVIVPSADVFHRAAKALGRYPTNVGLAATPHREDLAAYAGSLLERARRDFQLAPALSEPPEQTRSRQRGTVTNKLVIPCSDWGVSGVNASLEALGTELIRLGWDVEIVFTRDETTVLASAGDGGDGVHLPTLPYRYLDRPRPGVDGLWEALIADLEDAAPCVALTAYDFVANAVVPALTDDVGVVAWVQADDGDYYEQAYRLGRYCNALVCVSECIRGKVSSLNPVIGEKARVIPNSSMWDADVARRRSPLVGHVRLVYAGRLVQYQKRVLDFVDLAQAMDATGVPYTITLVGAFSSREEAREVFLRDAKEHLDDGRIRLPGRMGRKEILAELGNHDFFVLLSDFEGLPLALVEAMGRGCVPVVAYAESGIPEVVDPGRNGLVLRGRDYRQWADTIAAAWRDHGRFSRLSREARRTVRSRFTVERVAQQFDELLQQVAKEISRGDAARPPCLNWGETRSPTGDVLPPPAFYRPVNAPGLC